MLYNLLTNALRHTPSDGSIAVVSRPAADVPVAVEDTGEGLDAEAARRMFERFWRGDRPALAGGAGLGLAIARGLVEAQGGRIWAENRPRRGARVSFTLPLAERDRSLSVCARHRRCRRRVRARRFRQPRRGSSGLTGRPGA